MDHGDIHYNGGGLINDFRGVGGGVKLNNDLVTLREAILPVADKPRVLPLATPDSSSCHRCQPTELQSCNHARVRHPANSRQLLAAVFLIRAFDLSNDVSEGNRIKNHHTRLKVQFAIDDSGVDSVNRMQHSLDRLLHR